MESKRIAEETKSKHKAMVPEIEKRLSGLIIHKNR